MHPTAFTADHCCVGLAPAEHVRLKLQVVGFIYKDYIKQTFFLEDVK